MGYRIVYGPLKRARWWESRGLRVMVLSLLWFLVLVVTVSEGREGLWRLLWPGDDAVTAGAFGAFAEALDAGASVLGAFGRLLEELLGGL